MKRFYQSLMSDTPARLTVRHIRTIFYFVLMILSLKAYSLHERHEFEGCIMSGDVLDESHFNEFGNVN